MSPIPDFRHGINHQGRRTQPPSDRSSAPSEYFLGPIYIPAWVVPFSEIRNTLPIGGGREEMP